MTLRAQADGHRFVWWPSLLRPHALTVLPSTVTEVDVLPSRHAEVAEQTWQRCAAVLPRARGLAGSFARSSGPNCFGTVLGAAGADETGGRVVVEPFLAWLHDACTRGGRDDEPGTVLVWRDREGKPQHAAITIGDGWALEKPSQEWSTPRGILSVDQVISSNRAHGLRLERHRVLSRVPPV